MEIIKPRVELIVENNPFKKVEMAARTCYKSEANITDDSAKKMYKRLLSSKHTAMLEHAFFVFDISNSYETYNLCSSSKYINVTVEPKRVLASGNLRAILESNIPSLIYCIKEYDNDLIDDTFKYYCYDSGVNIVDFESLENKTENEINNHRYVTMKFITSRGVTHELVRHREFSFAQESTRYVNYNKTGMQFIEPADWNTYSENVRMFITDTFKKIEESYNALIENELRPQQARGILPNDIKTEIVVTGNQKEWNHFFNLRYFGTTGNPHPDIKVVAQQAYEIFTENFS